MGRLFWKFFFSYWAALLLAVIGVGTSAWLYRLAERDPYLSLEGGPRAEFVVESAAATLRHGGLAALRALLEEWGRRGRVRLLVVDDRGRDLLGRPVPAETLDRARRLAEADDSSPAARRVRLAGGDSYLLFIPVEVEPLQGILFHGPPPHPLVPLATGILASLVFGGLLAWYVARPIRHLREAFGALSQGRLETRVAPLMGRRRDEVADLGRDFDGMAQQLQSLITAQRSLLHDVSHELRSPLARLQAAVGLARQSPERLESSLERIEREAERLDELVGQLLTLSRLEARVAGDAWERWERIDLVDLVASIADDADFEARASGRRVVFAGEGELPVDARVELLHRAIENVVRNAVKYTGEGTAVEVSVAESPADTTAMVTVSDRGPGVGPEELEAIFQPFYRGGNGPPGPGSGLGLAITRRAVEAHGGRVGARRRAGGGLVIEIRIPRPARPGERSRGRGAP
jgi:two-component system OmpR family sensor kinase